MKLRFYFFIACPLFLWACADSTKSDNSGQLSREESVISKSIDYHFGSQSDSLKFSFAFRNKAYSVKRLGGDYTYTMSFSDSVGQHYGVLTNRGYTEQVNGSIAQLSNKDSTARANALNSVVYFNLLPLVLNDPAVHLKYLDKERIEGTDYHKIEVRFSEDGGGEDHDDVYLYWFDVEDHAMDYIAYSYRVNDGGTRFRKAVNRRRINGLVFQDYENYKGPSNPDSLMATSRLFKMDSLDLLSFIETNRIKVDRSTPEAPN